MELSSEEVDSTVLLDTSDVTASVVDGQLLPLAGAEMIDDKVLLLRVASRAPAEVAKEPCELVRVSSPVEEFSAVV